MKYTENALNILTTKTFKGIGDAWINKHLTKPLSFEIIVQLLQKDSKCKDNVDEDIFLKIRRNLESILTSKLENHCDGITAIGDDNFPKYRGNVKESERPNVLFYRGDLNLLSDENKNIAVIGVLNPDKSTEADERKIVHYLVQKNAVIVSGLALGCDTIAHDETVKSNGVTVAILPSPLNKIIPRENKKLADDIVANGGLLITEYYEQPKSAQENAGRFVKRDRLQALFSDAVLLSASYNIDSKDPNSPQIDSGSKHALEKAKEYGLQQAVIYNNKYAHNPKYDLNRFIIQDNKSAIILNPDNFFKELDTLFYSQNTQSIFQEIQYEGSTDDLFSLNPPEDSSNLFYLESTTNGVIITKNKKSFPIKTGDVINNGVKIILEYCLNQQCYTATIQNNIGFIKCFSDKEKQEYILAIKIDILNNEEDKKKFLKFFHP
ncbi:DNA-processing protein DprA [Mannheimia pernigra]|uniref:DNA-processing protein DprA n=1 Tax=Mannheimia pernigra TaxID=111844 RepID=A0A7D5DX09_9PAST|nr:DNA-processing protein DprA [Mannheimia pernigra]QLB39745.1 DNA-processing protein DprA [Mannheimia pernigra]